MSVERAIAYVESKIKNLSIQTEATTAPEATNASEAPSGIRVLFSRFSDWMSGAVVSLNITGLIDRLFSGWSSGSESSAVQNSRGAINQAVASPEAITNIVASAVNKIPDQFQPNVTYDLKQPKISPKEQLIIHSLFGLNSNGEFKDEVQL